MEEINEIKEEALRELKDLIISDGYQCHKETYELAIEALEKQIPKKPRPYIAFDGLEREGCPSHKENVILYAGQRFCDACGQAIDWSEDD